jgi:hypothetical protein
VQHRRALLVATTHGVHERAPQLKQNPSKHVGVTAGPRLRARHPQARHPGLHRPRIDRRDARLQLADRRRAITEHVRLSDLSRRTRHARVGWTAQLAAKQQLARHDVMPRRPEVTVRRQATHEQLVQAFLERTELQRTGNKRRRLLCTARRERSQRGIVQEPLAQPGETTPLDQQPRLEHRTGLQLNPLEQLAPHEPDVSLSGAHAQHIHLGPRGRIQPQRIAAQQIRCAECPAQLSQRPTQRPLGVRRVREQQRRQTLPSHRQLSQRQIREHRPRLTTPRRREKRAIPLQLGTTQKTHNQPPAHAGSIPHQPPATSHQPRDSELAEGDQRPSSADQAPGDRVCQALRDAAR